MGRIRPAAAPIRVRIRGCAIRTALASALGLDPVSERSLALRELPPGSCRDLAIAFAALRRDGEFAATAAAAAPTLVGDGASASCASAAAATQRGHLAAWLARRQGIYATHVRLVRGSQRGGAPVVAALVCAHA